MRICVTTSNKYLHLIPIFEYLYMKYWGDINIEIVGYEKPVTNLPFVSLGVQGDVHEWSTDLRRYFEKQDDWFIWMMEDTILKSVELPLYRDWPLQEGVGKIDLTNNITKRPHTVTNHFILAHPTSNYRLSTQPAIWNRGYLLKWLKPGMTPWQFEKQDAYDEYDILGFITPAIWHNEGVRKDDIYKVDLTGLPDEDIAHIKSICTWLK